MLGISDDLGDGYVGKTHLDMGSNAGSGNQPVRKGDLEGAGWEKMDRLTGSLSGCTEAVSQRFGAMQWGMTNGTGSNDEAVIQQCLSTWRGHEKIIYKFSSLIMN